jgi:putative FmdB family regulatory protein
MPIYEYQCRSCQSVFEEWQSGFEERDMVCPECGEPATRLISHTSFQLKGSGWYVTDYAGKKPGAAPDNDGNGNGNGGETAGCSEGSGADKASGGSDAVPSAKKGSSDTPSAGSAS